MKYLKIRNKGELDIRLVSLMGGSTKTNDKFKIGNFGTGLKYTLAWLFRNNVDFRLFIGNDEIGLNTENEIIRGETFEIVCINGQRSSITTSMGREWKAWMILREIWCNALDEEDAEKELIDHGMESTMVGKVGTTTFYIQISSDIQEVLDNWDKYFIPEGTKVLFQNHQYKLYPAGSHLCLYKNGVLIYENIDKQSVFRYDILDAQINELREYKSCAPQDISKAIKSMDEENIRYFVKTVTPEHYEGNNMDYNWYDKWGESWRSFAKSTKLLTGRIKNRFIESNYDFKEEEYTVLPECIHKSLTESSDGIGDMETVVNKHKFYEYDSPETEAKIRMCIATLRKAKYKMTPEIVFQYGFFEDKNQFTAIDERNKKLMISIGIKEKPIAEILAILVERNEQLSNNLVTLEGIKKHFVNLYTTRILPKNKEIVEEAIIT